MKNKFNVLKDVFNKRGVDILSIITAIAILATPITGSVEEVAHVAKLPKTGDSGVEQQIKDTVVEDDIIRDNSIVIKPGDGDDINEIPEVNINTKNLNAKEHKLTNITSWHKAGYTGKGLKVAIFDQMINESFYRGLGYNVKNIVVDKKTDKYNPKLTHGDIVFHTIAQILPDAEFYVYNSNAYGARALARSGIDFDIINISYTAFSWPTELSQFIDKGTAVIKSGGNISKQTPTLMTDDTITTRDLTFNAAAVKLNGQSIEETYYGQLSNKMDVTGFSHLKVHERAANGREMISTVSGTSISSPYIAGMTGLYMQRFKEVTGNRPTNAQLRYVFNTNSNNVEKFAKNKKLNYRPYLSKYVKEKKLYHNFNDTQRYGAGIFVLPSVNNIIPSNTLGNASKRLDKEWYHFDTSINDHKMIRVNQRSVVPYADELSGYIDDIYDLKTKEELAKAKKDFDKKNYRNGFPFVSGDAREVSKIYDIKLKDPSIPGDWEDALKEDDVVNTKEHKAFIKGYPDGTLKLNNSITREEAASIIYGLGASSDEYREFKDVKTNRWSYKYISNINVSGYKDGTFKPTKNITRAEALAIINGNINVLDNKGKKQTFKDINNHWAKKLIEASTEKGIVNGYSNGTFKPDKNITRAEFIVMVNNASRQCTLNTNKSKVDLLYDKYFVDLYKHWAKDYVLEALLDH